MRRQRSERRELLQLLHRMIEEVSVGNEQHHHIKPLPSAHDNVKIAVFLIFLMFYMISPVRLSSVCLSSVCNTRAPYSGGSNFRQYLYGIGIR